MAEFDDDERAKAFDRAADDDFGKKPFDPRIYVEFANIVQNYESEARPPHDDIDFVPADYDSVEFDDNGDPVGLYGIIVINLGYLGESFEDDFPDDAFDYLYNRLRGLYKPDTDDSDGLGYDDSLDFGEDDW